ncbi:MAG TPA: excinuclease ABC subunit UvrC [Candidatus Nanoarchaeia archaeon]|nr:excinuclease ABC subunit UvrC [Candidatus Nanoarchaeia archaeon]
MVDISSLPSKPGCYIYKDVSGAIIYVGKAGNLKKRVSQYFNRKDLEPKTAALVSNINSIDFIVTGNEVEALILENNLIKKHQPRYNIDLKDGKTYAYIELTNERFPKLIISRKRQGKVFGPFVDAKERNYILGLVNRAFKLRTCKRLPKKECLRYHMGLCKAPCVSLISESDYNNDVTKALMILEGKTSELIKSLQSELDVLKKSDFERAIIVRDELSAIKSLGTKQSIERKVSFDEDIINYSIRDGKVYLMVFKVFKGVLGSKDEFVFDYRADFLDEFINQYYSDRVVPRELISPKSIDESLISLYNFKLIIPKRGKKLSLLNLVLSNIDAHFFVNKKRLIDLQNVLGLDNPPRIIECFDISHLSGTLTVGSMIRFTEGLPDKREYRRYRIKGDFGIDDFRSIGEVVSRRYSKLKELPDLVVIDGGKGQLSFALGELKKINVSVPIISLAKKFEEIYTPAINIPIRLPDRSDALNLLKAVRDEAHRFAINYNKLLRKKELLK